MQTVGDRLSEKQYESLREEGWLPPAMSGELKAIVIQLDKALARERGGGSPLSTQEYMSLREEVKKWV